MANIYGILGISDTERVMLNSIGQRAVFDGVNEYLANYNEEIRSALSVFVEETTSDFKRRYMLPGGGMLQRRGGMTESAAVKATGYWDVAFPLEEYGTQIAATRAAFAYMTAQDLARHLDSVRIQDLNTLRFEMLRALFNSTTRTFADPLNGSLTIQPLANGDAVTYPPVLGATAEATETHYIETNYLPSAISDTNDPIEAAINELMEHFGAPTGGGNIVAFINNAQTAQIAGLTDFIEMQDRFVRPGTATAVPESLPAGLPGRVVGRHAAGAWVVEWRQWPAGYVGAIDPDAPAPLILREDPADTGLGGGLRLVNDSDIYPFVQSHYEHRFGFGVGNRLNGVILELAAGGSYTVPTGYAW